MTELRLAGSPLELESYVRRTARLIQLLVAVPATITLVWLEAWWVLPLPLALSFLVYEALFRGRGDPPTTLLLTGMRAEVDDPVRGDRLGVDLVTVEVAKATWQRTRSGADAVVLLADAAGPRLALRFALDAPDLGMGDVDADAADAVLGGQGSVLRAVAPFEAIARQAFEDPRGLAFLRQVVPHEAWARTGLRLWTGEAPPLDPLGYHLGEPDEWLVLDGTRWRLRRYGSVEVVAEGDLSRLDVSTRTRSLELVLRPGGEPETVHVPLLGVALSKKLRIHVPAPATEGRAPTMAPSASDRHTHPSEGAALLWHLLHHAPTLPEALRAAVEAAATAPERLPRRDGSPPVPGSATLPIPARPPGAPPAIR